MSADLGFSERRVQHYVAELVSGSFLRARQRGFNKSNVREFPWRQCAAVSCVCRHGFRDDGRRIGPFVRIPAGLPSGNQAVVVTIAGVASRSNPAVAME